MERIRLKSKQPNDTARITSIEAKLNERAHELAEELKATHRAFLPAKAANGIPVKLLPLDCDNSFAKMEQQLRRLRNDVRRNKPAIDKLQGMMIERVNELAETLLVGDRERYLDAAP